MLAPSLFFEKSLAYAEIYFALATVFSRFEFELVDTGVSDVQLAYDFYLPAPKARFEGHEGENCELDREAAVVF